MSSKKRRRIIPVDGNFPKRAQAIGSGSWRNFHSINTDALAEIHEMRRSVEPHTAVRRSKNCIQHRTDGALPISARDVEKA